VIPRITHGGDAGGLVRYLVGRGKQDEHTRPHVIAAAPGMSVPMGEALSAGEVQELAFDLELPRRLWGTEVMVKTKQQDGSTVRRDAPIWHLSLSLHPSDPARTDEQWAEIVRGAIARMGFDADPESGRAGCPWVAIHHGRNKGGCDHVHVAVSRVREDGSVASNWKDRDRLGRYAAEIEDRDGLRVVQGRRHGCVPEPGRVEQDLAVRRGLAETPRETLERRVRAAATASRDEGEFVRRLRKEGVAVRPRFGKGGTDTVVGYSVGLRTTGEGKIDWFGAGTLAPDLSLPALRASWGSTEAENKAASSVWARPRHSASPGREDKPFDAASLREVTAQVGAAVDRFAAVPAGSPDWASAASDTAGILGNLAARFEVKHPGPLSRASDRMAQAAQRRPGSPHAPRSNTADLRGVAAVAAQAMIPGGPVAWLGLLSQLQKLATSIEKADEARAGRQVAETRAGAARAELDRIHEHYRVLAPSPGGSGFDPTRPELAPNLPAPARGHDAGGLQL
jgi:hypothetical protein